MTRSDPASPTRRRLALGSTLGVILVVLGEFLLLNLVYHSGDGADARHEAWTRVQGATSAWRVGEPTTPVARAVARLEAVPGVDDPVLAAATRSWAADPTATSFTRLTSASDRLGGRLAAGQTFADRRAAAIFASLLALVSIGWFFWFRGVVRRQRGLQRSLTEAEVAMAGERRLTALVRNSADLVAVIDPDMTVSFASPSASEVLGLDPAELVGRRIVDLVAPEDAQLMARSMVTGGHGDQAVLLSFEHADGRLLTLEGTLTDLLAEETVGGWVLTVRDVTQRIKLLEELSHQSLHDALTGLANRQLFTDRLAHALRRRSGEVHPLVVLFLDLDDFKNVNDSQGHRVGDELLQEFAARVRSTIRPEDTAARLGGDEFAVLMEDCDIPTAQAAAARLLDALTASMTAAGAQHVVRCSVGLAAADPGETTAEEALRNADVALYFAKDRGKGRVAVYDSELHATALRRLAVVSELSAGIQAGDLVVHYQPAYRIDTGQVDGFEALVRWQHPVEGLLYPDRFVDIAEQTGLVVPLGRYVLREACHAAVTELTIGDDAPVMAVNVSARQLADAAFYDDVVEALHDSGLDPVRLVLEITESILLDDRDAVVATLNRLRGLGISIAIDDFGTGYSSLAYLADLPVNILKIDKSFVDGIGRDGESMVEAILTISESLGLVTVAEGIEEPHQLAWLQQTTCLVGQGYLWARPLPLPQARAELRRHPLASVYGSFEPLTAG